MKTLMCIPNIFPGLVSLILSVAASTSLAGSGINSYQGTLGKVPISVRIAWTASSEGEQASGIIRAAHDGLMLTLTGRRRSNDLLEVSLMQYGKVCSTGLLERIERDHCIRWKGNVMGLEPGTVINLEFSRSTLRSFSFNYTFNPEPGMRLWTQISDSRWVEEYPSGHQNTFAVLGKATGFGVSGTLVTQIFPESATTAPAVETIQMFIPDASAGAKQLKFRRLINGQWQPWGTLGNIEEQS